jgi:membrane-bound metal-dependent hydrolase YbcI (DUF457 family)
MAAVVGAGLLSAFGSFVLALAGAFGASVATFVGAIFPDIDHHKSIPRRKAVRAVRVLVWVGVVALAVLFWNILVAAVDTALVSPSEAFLSEGVELSAEIPPEFVASAAVFLVASLLAGLANPAIGLVTNKHRGWTHSVPVTFLLTLGIAGGVWLLTSEFVLAELARKRQLTAVSVVFTFFAGILIHLGLDDEIL